MKLLRCCQLKSSSKSIGAVLCLLFNASTMVPCMCMYSYVHMNISVFSYQQKANSNWFPRLGRHLHVPGFPLKVNHKHKLRALDNVSLLQFLFFFLWPMRNNGALDKIRCLYCICRYFEFYNGL